MQNHTGTQIDRSNNTGTSYNLPNQPLIPFYPENLKEKADYFKWIMSSINTDPKIVDFSRKNPKTQNMETVYALSDLVRVAGHFPSLDDAKSAMDRIVDFHPETIDLTEIESPPTSNPQCSIGKTSLPASANESSSTLPSNQLQFRELLTSITMSWNTWQTEEHLITIADFLQHVFPRLRPTEPKSLPGLYRKYLASKGELVSLSSLLFGSSSNALIGCECIECHRRIA
jgi:hypothetical protein